jgi:hypothetical protein
MKHVGAIRLFRLIADWYWRYNGWPQTGLGLVLSVLASSASAVTTSSMCSEPIALYRPTLRALCLGKAAFASSV